MLAPLAVTGDLDSDWQVMGAYGGWRMAGEAFLPILDLFAAQDQRLGSEVKKWMLSPQDKTISSDGQVWYGLGTNLRKAGAGVNIWNWGAWQFNLTGAKDGTLQTSISTFALRENSGTSWFVHATPQVEPGPPRQELERALFGAFGAVKRWN